MGLLAPLHTWHPKYFSTLLLAVQLMFTGMIVLVSLFIKYQKKKTKQSFGIVLWELLSCKKPWQDMNVIGLRPLLPFHFANFMHSDTELVRRVAEGERPPLSNNWPISLQELVKSCWNADPAARPRFGSIIGILEEGMLNPSRSSLAKDTST